MSEDELKTRARRWDAVSIKQRSERVAKLHYTTGYAFYSSIEHSDAMALSGYIAEWNEVGPRLNAGPTDDYLEIVLGHSAMVLAEVLMLHLRHFEIERPDIVTRVNELVNSITQ